MYNVLTYRYYITYHLQKLNSKKLIPVTNDFFKTEGMKERAKNEYEVTYH